MQAETTRRAFLTLVGLGTLAIGSQLLASGRPDAAPAEVSAGASTTAPAAAPLSTTPTTSPPTTTTFPLPPITGPVRLDERSRFDSQGIGPIEAGMTVAEAEQVAGLRFTIDRDDATAPCYAASADGVLGLRFVVQGPSGDARDGKIVRVEATDATWSTISGARVGSSLEEVRRLYRGKIKEVTRGEDGVLVLTVASTTSGVAFAASERQVVTAVYAGTARALVTATGCA